MDNKDMIRNVTIALLIISLLGICYGVYRYDLWHKPIASPEENFPEIEAQPGSNPEIKAPASPAPQEAANGLVFPIAEFKQRIAKKPFGIYVSPANSPVSPERFTGYHTAVDVEYQDVAGDVPVFAIADCQVILSKIATGYGGVFIVSADLNGSKHSVLYGHIRPSTLPKINTIYKKGSRIAFLGTGYSVETDNERRHLHFGVLADNGTDLRGYVQNKDELEGWIDPLTLF